jgi:large subunit ribosomal protein L30e
MADLIRDLRLAVDTGNVVIGPKEVLKVVVSNAAKLIIIAEKGKKGSVEDIAHMCGVAGIKMIKYAGGSMALGTACGKPYSVNAIAVLDQGHSQILSESY